jgi:hypothetical protein
MLKSPTLVTAWLFTCCLAACNAPMSPGQQLLEHARDLNVATRFGRMDVAAEHAYPATKSAFLARRSSWGGEVRVVDIDVVHVELADSEHADVRVQVAWTRMNDGLLHNTTVSQRWESAGAGKWTLRTEQREAGDVGLFGEKTARATEPVRDVHFATKSLGSTP